MESDKHSPIAEIKRKQRVGDIPPEVDSLPTMCDVLGSIPGTRKEGNLERWGQNKENRKDKRETEEKATETDGLCSVIEPLPRIPQ